MAIQYSSTGYTCLPSAGRGASVTNNTTANNASAWSELTASLSQDTLIVGLYIDLNIGSQMDVILDIGTGAASSETIVASIATSGSTANNAANCLFLPVPRGPISGGTRVAWRITLGSNSIGVTHYAKLLCIPATPSTITDTASTVPTYADLGTSIQPSGTAWANGAWVQAIASTSTDLAIYSLAVRPNISISAGHEWEIDIGTGGSGSETVIATLAFAAPNTALMQGTIPLFLPPLDVVPSGTRVALRCRSSQGTTSGLRVGLNYIPQ